MNTTARQFGRCTSKGCKVRMVVDPTTEDVTVDDGGWVTLTPGVRGDVTVNSKGLAFCTAHRALISFSGIKATVVTTMDCGPSCHNAKTEKCKCSCGGAEHGSTA